MLTRPKVLTLLCLAVAITSLVPLLGKHLLDLQVYRLGGQAVLHGKPLYAQRIGPYGFTYPPLAALLAAPFAAVPFWAASVALAAGSLASLAVLLRRGTGELFARLRGAPTGWTVVAVLALACCAPVRGTFWNGQVNLLLAALVLLDVQGRGLGGVGVGLAAAIKLTPAVFVLHLLVCGRRREAAHAVAGFALVTGLAWVVLPADSRRFWLHQLPAGARGGSGVGDESRTSNQSLHGMVIRLLGAGQASTVWVPLAAVALILGLRIAAGLTLDGQDTLAIGVVGVTGCVVSPVSWVHHWVWAVPLLAGLAQSARRPVTVAWGVVFAVVVVGWDQLPLRALPDWPVLTFVGQNDLLLCALVGGAGRLALTSGTVQWWLWSTTRSRPSPSSRPSRPDSPCPHSAQPMRGRWATCSSISRTSRTLR